MAIQRFIGQRTAGNVSDGFPSTGDLGATHIQIDTAKIYYWSGGWIEAPQFSANGLALSGFSGGGASGFTNVKHDYIVTNAPTGKRTSITVPAGGVISGLSKFMVMVEGIVQQSDSASGALDFDYLVAASGSTNKIWFNYDIPASTLIAFKYFFMFLILSVII